MQLQAQEGRMNRPHIVERAFELASQCSSLEELARKLDREGYSAIHDHLGGPTLRAQLSKKLKRLS